MTYFTDINAALAYPVILGELNC